MTPVLKLPMTQFSSPGLRRVFEVLGPGNAMLVGGCVRAAVLEDRRAYLDIDIATKLTPDEVTKRCYEAGMKVIPTGVEHGTVTVVPDGPQAFEITTLRRDVETDGRRAVVAFTESWEEDAQRRDFTMNTLLMDMDGNVYDPTGTGVADLKAGLVRFVGDAETRIKEDSLRILRFFRFHARYGKGLPNVTGYQACVHNRDLLKNLSRERVTSEVLKLLTAEDAAVSLKAMIEGGILEGLWQKEWSEKGYNILRWVAVSLEVEQPDMVLLMYCMKPKNAQALDELVAQFFVLSNRQKRFLNDILIVLDKVTDTAKKNTYLHGRDATIAATLLSKVYKNPAVDATALEAAGIAVLQAPLLMFPITARDIMFEFKIAEGKHLGDVLKQVEEWWLEYDGDAGKGVCLEQARRLLNT